jgi:hypothetical protein
MIKIDSAKGMSYAKLFGCDPGLISKASALGIYIGQSKNSLGYLSCYSQNGLPLGSPIPIKSSAITLAQNNNLGPSSKAVIRKSIENALQFAIDKAQALESAFSGDAGKIVADNLTPGQKAAFTKKLNKLAAGPNPIDVDPDHLIKLKDATHTLQSVYGSSPGSIYKVVALMDGIKIAIRRTSNKLSVRLEGDKIYSFKDSLSGMGFSFNPSYASAHWEVKETHMACKAVGAVIGAIGIGGVKEAVGAEKVGVV